MGKADRTADRITERQLTVLIFVSLLSPVIRVLPTAAVMFAGRAAWLSPLAALAAGKLLLTLTRYLRKNAPEGVGLADMALLGLGGGLGRIFCALCALWLTFYGGFVVRSAAERLLATVYPNGNPPIFIVAMLAVALFTAWGRTRSLSRTAEVLMPMLLTFIAVVLLSAVPGVASENLLPVTCRDVPRALLGALPIFNVLSAFVYFLFLTGRVSPVPGRPRRFPWLVTLSAVALAVTFFTLGTLGESLSISMENAFFMVIRNIRVFGVIERIESAVVAIWIVTDFIFVAAILMIVAEIWRTVTGAARRAVFLPPSAALAGAAAFFIAPDAFRLRAWSELLIPAINMTFSLVLIPAVMLVGKIRRKY